MPLKWEYFYKYISATTDSTPCHFPGIDGRVGKLQLLKGWKFMHCQFRTGSDSKIFIGCACQNDVHISNIITHLCSNMLRWKLLQLFVSRLTVYTFLRDTVLSSAFCSVHFAVSSNFNEQLRLIVQLQAVSANNYILSSCC